MTGSELQSCYEILELSPGADAGEIRRAYLHLKALYSGPSLATIPIDDEWDEKDKMRILEQLEEAYQRLTAAEAEKAQEPSPALARDREESLAALPEEEKPCPPEAAAEVGSGAANDFALDSFSSGASDWHNHEIVLPDIEHEQVAFAPVDGGGLGLLDEYGADESSAVAAFPTEESHVSSVEEGQAAEPTALAEEPSASAAGADIQPQVLPDDLETASEEETAAPTNIPSPPPAVEHYDSGSGTVVAIHLEDESRSAAPFFDPATELFPDEKGKKSVMFTAPEFREGTGEAAGLPVGEGDGKTTLAAEGAAEEENSGYEEPFTVELEEQWEPLPEAVRQELSVAYEQLEEFGRGPVRPLEKEDTLAEGFLPPEEVSGEVLKKLRLSRGVSIDEMSELLQIPAATLTAMEEEDFEQLSDAGYLRWEIMTYARELSLDARVFADHYMRRYRGRNPRS